MQVQTYLFFNGCCEEAADFYCQHLGAQVTMKMRFKDMPPSESSLVAPGSEDKIMHMSLKIGDTVVLASDGRCEGTVQFEGFSLSLIVSDDTEAERLFALLSDGGEVQMPMAPTFYASRFGMTSDRFGVSWQVMVAL